LGLRVGTTAAAHWKAFENESRLILTFTLSSFGFWIEAF
jgi:plasmid stability protein